MCACLCVRECVALTHSLASFSNMPRSKRVVTDFPDIFRKDSFIVKMARLRPGVNIQREEVCAEDGFCCVFSMAISAESHPQNVTDISYALGAFKGISHIGFPVEVCGLFRCLNNEINSCLEKIYYAGIFFPSVSLSLSPLFSIHLSIHLSIYLS